MSAIPKIKGLDRERRRRKSRDHVESGRSVKYLEEIRANRLRDVAEGKGRKQHKKARR